MDQSRKRPLPKPVQNERHNLGKPQVFVQLAFGVSWSERHTPRNHTVTYMSRNLKNARDSGNFPRQVPAPSTNYLAPDEPRQHRHREHPNRHHRQGSQNQQAQAQPSRGQPRSRGPERARGRHGDERPHQSRETRVETRGVAHERGSSAPPPINDSPWDSRAAASTATLFPHPPRASRDQAQVWKTLPASPGLFRLGEDGLPWSAWAWPADPDGDEVDTPYANNPTLVPLANNRTRGDDPERVHDLATLSTAMMTVDNGFENQWWYQGGRETTSWFPAEDEDARPLSMADALLLSAAEPPASGADPDQESTADLRDLVSPMSDDSSLLAPTFRGPLHRSLTTRSEELWLGR
ncbi:hypothetical protein F4778DRAFT_732989 [Xylariomycetidae sp. FL2044]|nr:hypothetical protein F4778DRAFT_732989 [Xylariomycetidae sp. FL2044]